MSNNSSSWCRCLLPCWSHPAILLVCFSSWQEQNKLVGDALSIQTGMIMVIHHCSVRTAPTTSSAVPATEKNYLSALLQAIDAVKERCRVAKRFNAQWSLMELSWHCGIITGVASCELSKRGRANHTPHWHCSMGKHLKMKNKISQTSKNWEKNLIYHSFQNKSDSLLIKELYSFSC